MAFIIGGSSLESEDGHQIRHTQVNERLVFILTTCFGAVNNQEGVSQMTHPNLSTSLRDKLMQYTLHTTSKAPNIHNQTHPICLSIAPYANGLTS